MLEAIEAFLMTVKAQKHVLPLINQANIRITLQFGNEAIQLVVKNGEIFLIHDSVEQSPKYEIRGSLAAMKQLLTGKEKLRRMERRGELTVNAPLRMALLLESLFYLTKPTLSEKNNFEKII